MVKKSLDSAMVKVLAIFKKSGLTLNDLGLKMGYEEDIARQSAFQFLKTADPRISMLRRFATAMEIDLAELVAVKPKK